jgi:hypothetical protein
MHFPPALEAVTGPAVVNNTDKTARMLTVEFHVLFTSSTYQHPNSLEFFY